ncbi:MAG TPA: tyrosine-type recombinase/integrase [Oligoflexia bacterium]|nr:tyrosine-type recombinase/integrase [Oligoflexia bacterium]
MISKIYWRLLAAVHGWLEKKLKPISAIQAPPIIIPEPAPLPVPIEPQQSVGEQELWQTLWAFLDSFLKTQNSPHTRRAYERDLEDFLCFIDSNRTTISVHSLVRYREELRTKNSSQTGQPLSHVSINRKIATIKSFLNWLVLNGVLPNNPAKAVKSFKAGRDSPTRDIPDDRVRAMLDLPARHTVAGRMHHAMLMVLFHLGLRRSELVDLRTSDLFEREGMRVLRVRGKGDKERVLPVPEPVQNSLDQYLLIARKTLDVDQPLFTPVKNNVTKTKEKNLHPNAVAYVVKHYAKLAGIHYRVSPHSARATAVSNALDHHAPHRSVQHMAGWSSPLMVTRYDKRKEELKNSAVRFVQYSSDPDEELT